VRHGLVLGLGYGHWIGGALAAGIGVALTELKLFTQPTASIRALALYRSGDLQLASAASICVLLS
jgi:hypothetical protein